MTNKARVWLQAARLRTLPLSISGILVGNGYSLSHPRFSWVLFYLMLTTAILFQIISNFANDYGDGVKGTDNANRVGPQRALQAGLLTPTELKRGIFLTSLLALVVSFVALFLAFGLTSIPYFIVFLFLSLASVWAAISYTVGKNAYGYSGLGDLFVFLFFGLLSVLGSYFVQTQTITSEVVLLALVVGFLSVGVLNLNNMRDRENDATVGKTTMVVWLGPARAKSYHYLLLVAAMTLILIVFIKETYAYFWLPFLALGPLGLHFFRVSRNKNPQTLDPELKTLALSTFAFSVLSFITFYLS